MSPTLDTIPPDTATLGTPILEAPILESNAPEVIADAGFEESDSSDLVAVIKSSPEEANGEAIDTETSAGETGTLTADEQSPQAQQNGPIKEMGAKKGRQRQQMPRKSMLRQLDVPLPTKVLTAAPGEAVTGEARKIGRRPDKNAGAGQSPVPAAKDQNTKAKAARVKNSAKSQGETQVEKQSDANPVWEIKLLPVEEIGPNPFQPREQFSEEEMEELAGSVAEHGVQTPILVRPCPLPDPQPGADADSASVDNGASVPLLCYELVAGERRLRASQRAKRRFIPAIVRGDLSDQQAAELALIENVQRSSLNVIEEARGYKRLMLRFGFTEARIAKKVGKSVLTVQAALKLLALPEEVQTLLLKKQLSAAHGHELLRLVPHPLICTSAALVAVAEKLPATSLASNPLPNVRELKRRGRVVELGYATKFDWKRECQECPHKAFVTSGYGSYCLLPEQWKAKQSHAISLEEQEAARVLEEARKQGEAQVEIQDLPPGSYRSLQWNEPPAGCSAQCPCRGQAADPRDASKSIPVCLDPARLESLRLAQREAQEAERGRHYHALWKDSVQRLSPFSPAAFSLNQSLPLHRSLPLHQSLSDEVETTSNGWHPEREACDHLESCDHSAIPPSLTEPEPASTPLQSPTGQVAASEVAASEVAASEVANSEMADSREAILGGQIVWTKIAPLLVLPILRGENCSYGEREQWEDKAREVAEQMGIELPWEEILDGKEVDVLPRLEPVPPQQLLFLGAVLLLRQEAIHAGHWAGETPFLNFVLDLQSARQSELEVSESEVSEMEGSVIQDDTHVRDDSEETNAGAAPARSDKNSVREAQGPNDNAASQNEVDQDEVDQNEGSVDKAENQEHDENLQNQSAENEVI